ncbi:methylmalonyl Co-A mutase-associated GTPase MeaB [Blastococcus sp. CT_GayMR20]|nr:methylmalonyl Co-A mutase-associated GTPase MeaB [Blastococcus sp. CT_GayMR20]
MRRSLRAPDVDKLVEDACAGQLRAVSRLLSLVEEGVPDLPRITAALAERPGHAHVIGLTGAPGVGKSTSASALVDAYRRRGARVAVLAVDPSSPLSGGALLGDRVRMQEHAGDRGVFVRSMASRGQLGGLSRATPQALRVLDAAGFDVVLLETVGVGQSEVSVAGMADTTLVLLAPGLGDGVQAAKAGLLEVADVFVVNKADTPGAEQVVRDLRRMLSLDHRRGGERWRTPVLKTNAVDHEGYDEVLEAVDRHVAWSATTGEIEHRRTRRAGEELDALVRAAVTRRLAGLRGGEAFRRMAAEVAGGRSDPYSAADRLIGSLLS